MYLDIWMISLVYLAGISAGVPLGGYLFERHQKKERKHDG